MYKAIYYQREKNLIHLWDDRRGYQTFPYTRYAYERAENGEYRSIYGDRLTKIYKFTKDTPGLFEADVPETTRVLVDTYQNSDEVSSGHTILTYDIEVEMETGLPDVEQATNAITSIALHDSANDQYYVLVHDVDGIMQYSNRGKAIVEPFATEEELLSRYLELYESINPSIVTGWNIDYFDTPYLYNRISNLMGTQQANRLSPIGVCSWSKHRRRYTMAGVSYIDYMTAYKYYNFGELPNYRLDTVAKLELGHGKVEYDGNLDKLFREDIEKFIEYNLVDVKLVVELDRKLEFIDLCRDICHAGHVAYEDFVYSSKILEGALLTYLHRDNLIAPNKKPKISLSLRDTYIGSDSIYVDVMPDEVPRSGSLKIHKTKTSSFLVHYNDIDRDKRRFILDEPLTEFVSAAFDVTIDLPGAYVKSPLVGKYEWIYDLDLTSLYPSIIMTLNISPETKVGRINNWNAQEFINKSVAEYDIDGTILTRDQLVTYLDESKFSVASNGVLYRTDKTGCIPGILDLWFRKRVEYKNEMKKYGNLGDDDKYKFYHKRQLVQKILLNSLYGVLGLVSFRFYDVDNAEAVTSTGQAVIKSTADVTNIKYNKELNTPNVDQNIYIDTDSVFFSAEPIMNKRIKNWKDQPDDVIAGYVNDIAQEVQDYLNGFYDVFAKKVLNVDKHRLDIKKEYVAKAGLWVAKKRYAQWIISDNGVPVDKLDVKGLDIKRSSFPKSFQEIMSDVMISILRSKTETEVTSHIADFKKKMNKLSIEDVAKNSAVKNMSKYIPKGNREAFSTVKGTPAHVKAAIAYNDLLQHYKLPYKYQPMKDGDKIKWVYLKNNPFGIDGLGFAGYNDPPEIMEFLNTYVDHDKLFERELQGKLQDFYDAVGWSSVVSKEAKSKEFFSF